MGAALDRDTIEKAYARWAPVYDIVFGAVFERGRMATIAAAEEHLGAQGGRILEVGVGTGISLQSYNRKNRLVGIDISAPMLRRAQDRVIEHRLTNVEALAVMDAKHLAVPDASFDAVVAQYVITAVPDPEATPTSSCACSSLAARSFWSTISAPSQAFAGRSSRASRRSRGGSAGARSFPGTGWCAGPSATASA